MSMLLIVGFVTMVARQLYLRMHQLARVDLLTGLPNRRAIEEAVRRETARSHRLNQPLSLVLLDVDHFKQINDRFGHQGGDTVLQALALAVVRLLRPSDTFGRYGSEEFCAILPGMDERAAFLLAKRIRRLVEDMKIVMPGGAATGMTVSLGVAAITPSGNFDSDWGRAFELADRALYGAKQGGRNRKVGASVKPETVSPSSATLISIWRYTLLVCQDREIRRRHALLFPLQIFKIGLADINALPGLQPSIYISTYIIHRGSGRLFSRIDRARPLCLSLHSQATWVAKKFRRRASAGTTGRRSIFSGCRAR